MNPWKWFNENTTHPGEANYRENALRLKALERADAAAQREEENLLRRQGMANFATSPSLEAAYPEFIAQGQQRNALDQADPAAALGRLESKLYPKGFTGTLGENQVAYIGGEQVATGPAKAPAAFKPVNMQIPDTNRIVVARTPEEFNAYVDEGFVEQGSGVPGAKEEPRPYRVMTKEEVRAAGLPEGGSYKTNGLDVQAIVQPNRDQGPGALKLANAEVEAESLGFALDEFERIVRATPEGARTGALFGGLTKEGQDLNSAWTNAALIAKGEALFNLGVLSGPDLTIIQKALPDPSTKSGVLKDKDTYYKGIEQIRNLMNRRLEAARRAYAPPSQQSGRGASAPLGDDVESLLNKYAPRN